MLVGIGDIMIWLLIWIVWDVVWVFEVGGKL